ncbi:hypothetical protein Ancab_034979 [Ancistrocladus abbreviatus]
MENNKENFEDFTFCQVGPPINQNGLDSEQSVPDISSITIKDNASGSNSRDQTPSSSFLWEDKLPINSIQSKQEKVGSLYFNIIDASVEKQLSEPQREAATSSGVSSAKGYSEQKTALKKPVARAKVPFEKGYSQMDWLKLTRTHPDLAGIKGQSNRRLISMSEVKQHQTEGSMWTVLKGRVYNIYPYMKFHPGGVDMLMKAVGKDCTSLFNKYHAWVNAEFLLEKCLVGILDDNH